MTQHQMTFMVVLMLMSILSVGAFLLTMDNGSLANHVPDPSTLPATPSAPNQPPFNLDDEGMNDGTQMDMTENMGTDVNEDVEEGADTASEDESLNLVTEQDNENEPDDLDDADFSDESEEDLILQ